MAYTKNAQGGVDPTDFGGLARAAQADLVTLPETVQGTNCANCLWARPSTPGQITISWYWCAHPKVDLPITPRMCCALWDATGTRRAWLGAPR